MAIAIGRISTTTSAATMLAREVTQALGNGGNLLVPAFAIERSQELIGDLVYLMARGKLPKAPIYLDSPLAIRATEVFERHLHALDDIDPAGGLAVPRAQRALPSSRWSRARR